MILKGVHHVIWKTLFPENAVWVYPYTREFSKFPQSFERFVQERSNRSEPLHRVREPLHKVDEQGSLRVGLSSPLLPVL